MYQNLDSLPFSYWRNSTYLSKSLTKSKLDVLVMCLLNCVLQISSYNLPISLKKLSIVVLDSLWFSSIQALQRQSHEGFMHDVMESNATIIPAPIKNSCNWTLCYHTRFDAKVPRARVLEALANNGQQGAGWVQAVWNTPILSTISLNLSLCFHWTSVALIQCFVKDENDALQLERLLDL